VLGAARTERAEAESRRRVVMNFMVFVVDGKGLGDVRLKTRWLSVHSMPLGSDRYLCLWTPVLVCRTESIDVSLTSPSLAKSGDNSNSEGPYASW